MPVKKIILVLCVILYTAAQASSLKCYFCISTYKEECYTNPKQEKFELACPFGKNTSALKLYKINKINSTFLTTVSNIKKSTDSQGSEVFLASDSGICGTVIGIRKGEKVVLRGCVPKKASLEDIKKIARIYGVTAESWTRCDTDLCNYLLPE